MVCFRRSQAMVARTPQISQTATCRRFLITLCGVFTSAENTERDELRARPFSQPSLFFDSGFNVRNQRNKPLRNSRSKICFSPNFSQLFPYRLQQILQGKRFRQQRHIPDLHLIGYWWSRRH